MSSSSKSTSSGDALATPSSSSVLFARGLIARLSIWLALRIAVDHSWGGPESAQKRTWIASVLVDAFEGQTPPPDATYVELTLLQILEDEFGVILEDGSVERVAEDIVQMWDAVQAGSSENVLRFEAQAESFSDKSIYVQQISDDDNDWQSDIGSEESDQVPMLLDRDSPQVEEMDDDGFKIVREKGTKHS